MKREEMTMIKGGLKASLCDCINGEFNTAPENRLLHLGNICHHDDGTHHEINLKN